MFGAGLIKMRGDPCWRDLSCLDYHFETQPMPNPVSRFFHLLPAVLRRWGVAFNHLAELIMPCLYFAPQPLAVTGGAVSAAFLFFIIVSGNFAWLNWLAFILCFSTVTTGQLPFLRWRFHLLHRHRRCSMPPAGELRFWWQSAASSRC
nr:lipase maturation factor family protein [Geotalea toluenoxydans]